MNALCACMGWVLALLLPSLALAQTFTNPAVITIPGSGTAPGAASPYPSTINVTGLPVGTIANIRARVRGFQHTWPLDVDVLLVAPGGQTLVLFGDRCGTSPFPAPVDLTFEDGAPALPTATCASGTYAPGGISSAAFPGPAPAGPYGSTFASLGLIGGPSAAANGNWQLFVYDDAGGDTGQFGSGWELIFTVDVPPQFSYTPTPPVPVIGVHTTGTIGSTANLTINVAIGTAGSGTGAAATTTTTCSAPPAPFAGFTQTPTAVGSGPVSPTSITGTCTVAATAQTATLNCVENRGGTNVPITFDLVCPAATNVPPNLTLTPPPGSTITGSGGGLRRLDRELLDRGHGHQSGGTRHRCRRHDHLQLHPAGSRPSAGFTGTMQAVGNGPLTGSPITGTCTVGPAPVTVTMTCQLNQGGNISDVTYQLVCPLGLPEPRPVDTLDRFGLALLALFLLALGAVAYRRLS
ncbi:MAG: hypothetical protein KatS3mg125_0352 [Lysobacterales bacterium]|nr:MAG: hypothetical protein KatS3mg125_0352 [Xanthomonadales bacterium]